MYVFNRLRACPLFGTSEGPALFVGSQWHLIGRRRVAESVLAGGERVQGLSYPSIMHQVCELRWHCPEQELRRSGSVFDRREGRNMLVDVVLNK